MRSTDATLFMVALGRGSREAQLRSGIQRLITLSGGRGLFVERSDKLDEAFAEIVVELSNQYLIGYQSTNTSGTERGARSRLTLPAPPIPCAPARAIARPEVRKRCGITVDCAIAARRRALSVRPVGVVCAIAVGVRVRPRAIAASILVHTAVQRARAPGPGPVRSARRARARGRERHRQRQPPGHRPLRRRLRPRGERPAPPDRGRPVHLHAHRGPDTPPAADAHRRTTRPRRAGSCSSWWTTATSAWGGAGGRADQRDAARAAGARRLVGVARLPTGVGSVEFTTDRSACATPCGAPLAPPRGRSCPQQVQISEAYALETGDIDTWPRAVSRECAG